MGTRAVLVAALAMPATAVIRGLEKGKPPGPQPGFRKTTWRNRITSHETFTHDSLDSLGYDWERIGNPWIAPRFPLKVYLPQTTDDVVKVLKEVRALDEKLAIRSKGHSSNDLVLGEPGGSVLVTEKLNQLIDVDEENLTATVQAGAVSAQIDDRLSTMGLGLPIIGDHNHITVGGFASVGGISPASHRFGLFVDTVERLEYVNWEGEVITASRTENSEHFFAVLTGMGQHGVITTITVRIIRVDKYGTVLKNHQKHYWDVDAFIKGAGHGIRNPGEALMERGVWVSFPGPGGRSIDSGQFSAYHPTEQTKVAHLRDQISYTYLNSLGFVAGRLPRALDKAMKFVGMTGVLFSPQYATMKNVEFFTDKILDSTVGDPTRMFIILAPLDRFDELFRAAYDLMVEYRDRYGCFTFLSVYVKSIRSPYLAQGGPNDSFCELMFYNGIVPEKLQPVLEELVDRFDDVVIDYGGFRYMHSRTSKDPERRRKVNPNSHYSLPGGGPPPVAPARIT